MGRISICNSQLKWHKTTHFWKEQCKTRGKVIVYNNMEQKRSRWKRKTKLHRKKVIPCSWCDWKGVVYCELLLQKSDVRLIKCSNWWKAPGIGKSSTCLPLGQPQTSHLLVQLDWDVLLHYISTLCLFTFGLLLVP